MASTSTDSNLNDAIIALLGKKDASTSAWDGLIATHGQEPVEAWRLTNKHKHAIVHELATRGKEAELTHLVKNYNFNINIPRASDQCTPLHLAGWTKKPELMKILLNLGANPKLENKYGENCDRLLETVAKMENLAWLDLELTHLPAEGSCEDAILECCLIITTKDFRELDRASWIIAHTEEELKGLSEWHQTNFASVDDGGNGLFADVLLSKTDRATMEEEILGLLKKHCIEGLCRLAGNSVHCDREVLLTAMPRVYKFCCHQVIDVSTIINLTRMWCPHIEEGAPVISTYNHRAEGDIESSILMLKFYKDNLFFNSGNSNKIMRTE